jgi:hypothetical protein
LGTGRLGDVAGPGAVATERVLDSGSVHLAVTRWVTANREVPVEPRVTQLEGVFPLVRYLAAFDFAISSAGYNAVHELVPSGLPTLFVSNTSTRTDDQVTRARRLEELGLALHARDDHLEAVATQTERLLDPTFRRELAAATTATRTRMVGAREVAERVTGLIPPADAATMRELERIGRLQDLRDALKRVLGERGTNVVRRLLGRTPRPVGQRTTVRLVDRPEPAGEGQKMPLAFTDVITPDDLLLGSPVEHVLPGSSPLYRRHRRELIDKYYRVRG